MARRTNIMRIINTELEKGNSFLNNKGEFVSTDVIKEELKKEYIVGLQEEKISVNLSFTDYYLSQIHRFHDVEEVKEDFQKLFAEELVVAEGATSEESTPSKEGAGESA